MQLSKPVALSREQVAAFEAEVDAIRNAVMNDLGQQDVDHIRKMIRIARASEIGGRALLHFGVGPLSWVAGVLALANAKILDNMEIGHNVMHGQYDWCGDPALHSQTFEWDIACDGEQWRHSHNVVHHTHTGILGKDRDIGYSLLRMSDAQRWKPRHRFQPLANLLLALGFQYAVGSHDLEIGRYKYGKMSKPEFKSRLERFLAKVGKQWFKDYLLFPALALWSAPRVLAGNFTANLIRNLWAYLIIFCGHFTDGVAIYREEDTRHETRGDWYIRQLTGSSNLTGGRLFHIMSGHLSHQIEHHLFPDMPAHRYPQVAPQLAALCRKYGLHYNTGSLSRQYLTVIRRILAHARAPKPAAMPSA
ncbi:fatty acid desaturase family protein [Noviherbaspirillum autotrophicum]|uniref:Fatty acid desaturase n=1 Tax=Noviherbaspirillum autotrophicum TaxID=709839 RepID=A0A0C1Y493_9BURK|nr:acyl-CoA desaturase [Noviherbaspirillum autotrophicum]KIF81868.1 fatty acid desaturase [Noviherbaspirillum autotrophicum]